MPLTSNAGFRRGPRSRIDHSTGSRRASSSASSASYSSDTVTTAACTVRPSRLRHAPSGPRTLLAMTTWVCRFGSPARVSQWSKAAATIPRVRT